jgi:hypothetical protein
MLPDPAPLLQDRLAVDDVDARVLLEQWLEILCAGV